MSDEINKLSDDERNIVVSTRKVDMIIVRDLDDDMTALCLRCRRWSSENFGNRLNGYSCPQCALRPLLHRLRSVRIRHCPTDQDYRRLAELVREAANRIEELERK